MKKSQTLTVFIVVLIIGFILGYFVGKSKIVYTPAEVELKKQTIALQVIAEVMEEIREYID